MARANEDPVRLGDSLHGVVRGLKPQNSAGGAAANATSAATLGGVFGRWEHAVGAAVAAHVQPLKLDGTTLVVTADDPAWATQLRFLEATLRQRLRDVAGAEIDTIEVRVVKGGR